MSLKVIQADISHVPVIAHIGRESFRMAFENLFINKQELKEYLDYTYDHRKLVNSIGKEKNIYLLALQDELPVGFAKLKRNSLNTQIESVAQMELQKIYVLFEHHGKGAGSALLNQVKKITKDINPDYLWLDTHISNAKAIRFYEKNEFKKIGKYYFTIGKQTFEYDLMAWPVASKTTTAC